MLVNVCACILNEKEVEERVVVKNPKLLTAFGLKKVFFLLARIKKFLAPFSLKSHLHGKCVEDG